MRKSALLSKKTIADFGDQWSTYREYDSWFGSFDFLRDLLHPLLDIESLNHKSIAEIGSGTGRIVNMLLEAGADQVYAIEPSPEAFRVLKSNVAKMKDSKKVTPLNITGDRLTLDELDYVFSIGVLHHIPDPEPVLESAYESLKPGGHFFAWLYGYEGNQIYIKLITALRKLTTVIPHFLLRSIVEIIYFISVGYMKIDAFNPLPLHGYIDKVYKKLSPHKRRLVIYDQLNPAYAKYYKREEVIDLFKQAGFANIKTHNRHGYSWSVLCKKPSLRESN